MYLTHCRVCSSVLDTDSKCSMCGWQPGVTYVPTPEQYAYLCEMWDGLEREELGNPNSDTNRFLAELTALSEKYGIFINGATLSANSQNYPVFGVVKWNAEEDMDSEEERYTVVCKKRSKA